jgi:hypothetical protein
MGCRRAEHGKKAAGAMRNAWQACRTTTTSVTIEKPLALAGRARHNAADHQLRTLAMRITRHPGLLLAALYLAACASAQAYYRGDECVNRDYSIGGEFFLDKIVIIPPIEARLDYQNAALAYLGAAGSLTKEDLYLLQYLKLSKALGSPLNFLFNFEMDQDFDNYYQHHILGLAYPVTEHWAIEVLGEPIARKEFSDVGAAISRQEGRSRLQAALLLPNFFFVNKNDWDGEFIKQPYTILLNARQPVIGGLDLYANLDWDLPSDTDYRKPEFDFTFKSCKPGAGFIWQIETNQMLWSEVNGETTDKERTSYTRTSVNDFSTRRRYLSGRLEYVFRDRANLRYSAGGQYVYLDEENFYPNDNKSTFNLDHISRIVYGTVGVPLKWSLRLNTGLYFDFAHHVADYYRSEEGRQDSSGLEGKVPVSLAWAGKDFALEVGASVQTDRLAFGGGFAGAHVIF